MKRRRTSQFSKATSHLASRSMVFCAIKEISARSLSLFFPLNGSLGKEEQTGAATSLENRTTKTEPVLITCLEAREKPETSLRDIEPKRSSIIDLPGRIDTSPLLTLNSIFLFFFLFNSRSPLIPHFWGFQIENIGLKGK